MLCKGLCKLKEKVGIFYMEQIINVHLNVTNRVEEVELAQSYSKIELEVSRSNCKDVLLELIDDDGNAKGKPLCKYGLEIKGKHVHKLRFTMNDFSTQPVTVSIKGK